MMTIRAAVFLAAKPSFESWIGSGVFIVSVVSLSIAYRPVIDAQKSVEAGFVFDR